MIEPDTFHVESQYPLCNGYILTEWRGDHTDGTLYVIINPLGGPLSFMAPAHEEEGELPAHIVKRLRRRRRWWRR